MTGGLRLECHVECVAMDGPVIQMCTVCLGESVTLVTSDSHLIDNFLEVTECDSRARLIVHLGAINLPSHFSLCSERPRLSAASLIKHASKVFR